MWKDLRRFLEVCDRKRVPITFHSFLKSFSRVSGTFGTPCIVCHFPRQKKRMLCRHSCHQRPKSACRRPPLDTSGKQWKPDWTHYPFSPQLETNIFSIAPKFKNDYTRISPLCWSVLCLILVAPKKSRQVVPMYSRHFSYVECCSIHWLALYPKERNVPYWRSVFWYYDFPPRYRLCH